MERWKDEDTIGDSYVYISPTINRDPSGDDACLSDEVITKYEVTITKLTDKLEKMTLAMQSLSSSGDHALRDENNLVPNPSIRGADGCQILDLCGASTPINDQTILDKPQEVQIQRLTSQLEKEAKLHDETKKECADLLKCKKKFDKLKLDNESLQSQLDDKEQECNDLEGDLEELESKNKLLESKNKRLTERIKRLMDEGADDEDTEEKDLQIRRLKQQMETLQEDMQNRDISFDDVMKQNDNLEKENQRLTVQNDELQAKEEEQASKIDHLVTQLKKKEEEIQRLITELGNAKRRSESSLGLDPNVNTATLKRNDKRIKSLEEELKEREQRITDLEEENEQLDDLRNEIKKKDREIEKAKKECERHIKRKKEEFDETLDTRCEDIKCEWEEKLKEKEVLLKSTKRNLEGKVRDLQKELEKYNNPEVLLDPEAAGEESGKAKEYKEKLEKAEGKLHEFKRTHEHKIGRIQEEHRMQVADLKEEIKMLEKNVNTMNEKKKELVNRLSEMKIEKEKVMVELRQKQFEAANDSEARDECMNLRNKLEKSKEELESERAKSRNVSEKMRQLERSSQQEIQSIAELTLNNEKLSENLHMIMERIRNLNSHLKETDKSKMSKESNDYLVELELRVHKLLKDMKDSERYIELLRKEMKMKGNSQKNTELTQTIERTGALLAESQTKQKEAEEAYRLLDERCKALNNFIVFLQDKLELLTTPTFEGRTQPLPIYMGNDFVVGQRLQNGN